MVKKQFGLTVKQMRENSVLLFGLSKSTANCLIRHGIHTVGDLCDLDFDFLCGVRGLGIARLGEIRSSMERFGIMKYGQIFPEYRIFSEKTVYNRIEQLVQEKGFSFYRLSKEVGIRESTFSDWRCGRTAPAHINAFGNIGRGNAHKPPQTKKQAANVSRAL